LELFGVPLSILPEVKPSSTMFGFTDPMLFRNSKIPITGIAGDQQASLYGHGCKKAGMVKNTYGTGCFMLMNTGEKPVFSHQGLLTTIAWQIGDEVFYALEGSVFMAGATIQWLRDNLGIIRDASETNELAQKVPDNGGVYFVPAFAGLGAPYWDMHARGAILGLTRAAQKEHIARAALESIAFQTMDVLTVIKSESNLDITSLVVDGGASANGFLMQFQADILGVEVARNQQQETTALGAALIAESYFENNRIKKHTNKYTYFYPNIELSKKQHLLNGWKEAIKKVSTNTLDIE
jgi:glycerol kinase